MASTNSKKITRQTLTQIWAAQEIKDREKELKQQHEQTYDVTQHYPSAEIMAVMIVSSIIALFISLFFGVVSVSIIYVPAAILISVTIIVLRQIAALPYSSYWRQICLMLCFVTTHVMLVLCVVPVIDIGFAISYRINATESTKSNKMENLSYLFRHYLFGDVCILFLATEITIYCMLGCLLCYGTRAPIYTSYPIIDLTNIDQGL